MEERITSAATRIRFMCFSIWVIRIIERVKWGKITSTDSSGVISVISPGFPGHFQRKDTAGRREKITMFWPWGGVYDKIWGRSPVEGGRLDKKTPPWRWGSLIYG